MATRKIKNILLKGVVKLKQVWTSIIKNRDLLVFFLFFLLSTGLWFLNALRKEYTTTISYPVKYSDYPEDFIMLGEPLKEVQLKIRSLGYTLLPYHIGKIVSPENLRVSSFKRMNGENKHGAFVLTRDLNKSFADKLANGIDLLDIYPDTLFVELEQKQRKRVPVRFKSSLSFKPQYYQSGDIMIKPDSIEISGPASFVDTTNFVYTENKKFIDLSDSLVRNMSLRGNDNLVYNPGRVLVNIPVEPFTEKILRIPVSDLNVPDSLRLKSFPANISVSFTVAVSRFNSISANDFTAVVDYSSHTGAQLPDRLKVKLVNMPKGIESVDYSPLFIDCLFEKVR